MRRAIIAGAALLFCGIVAARSNTEPLVFVFLRVDKPNDIALLRPMIAPDVGVQLDSGSRNLSPNAVLHCSTVTREHHATVEGQTSTVSELLLKCGEQTFVVKTLDFTPSR
jgi:hypothetical protein